jgi:electron transport complex protein RnfG
MSYIIRPAVTLFITAVITIAALSVVYNYTLEPIQVQRFRKQEAAMSAVLPQASDFREIPAEKSGSIVAIYEALNGGVLAGYVVALSPSGYSGNIDLMVGISLPDERISGMRVVRHSETPGLGALATREDFYRRFDNRALVPLAVVRTTPGEHEISAITSSTITSRAITNAVNEAIEWYRSGGGR